MILLISAVWGDKSDKKPSKFLENLYLAEYLSYEYMESLSLVPCSSINCLSVFCTFSCCQITLLWLLKSQHSMICSDDLLRTQLDHLNWFLAIYTMGKEWIEATNYTAVGRVLAAVNAFKRGARIPLVTSPHFHTTTMQTLALVPYLTASILSRSCLLISLMSGHTFLHRPSSIL